VRPAVVVVNIRCCCDPNRVLGRVALAAECVYDGARVHFPIAGGGRLSLEIQTASEDRPFAPPRIELAIRSDETPLAVLRQIHGFVEVDRVEPIAEFRAPRGRAGESASLAPAPLGASAPGSAAADSSD